MASDQFDAIIVGARIAGAATALALNRRGWRVLLLDATTFPSDTLSTHLLWSDALAAFDRLGLLPQLLATGAPPITQMRLTFGDLVNEALIPTREDYPPLLSVRRLVLDALLLRHARQQPGITIWEGVTVRDLLRAGDGISGIVGQRRATGATVTARARVTIGADGRHSTVAQVVAAATYDVVPPLLATYYRYYRDVPALARATLEAFRDAEGGFCYLFPCDAGYWTLAVSFPQAAFAAIRQDHEAQLAEEVARKPGLAERLACATAVTPWRGAGDLTNFFRVPAGPGWALVGDAGYHRDPITGRGIPDALQSADLLAAALDSAWRGTASYEDALASYQRERDALVRPLYDFTVDRPPASVAHSDWWDYLGQAFSDSAFLSRYIGFMAAVTPPAAFYSAEAVQEGR